MEIMRSRRGCHVSLLVASHPVGAGIKPGSATTGAVFIQRDAATNVDKSTPHQ